MDETPEELERIRQEADKIDPYRYRKRNRAMAAIASGGPDGRGGVRDPGGGGQGP